MRYKILKQSPIDERMFELESEEGERYLVDFYTGGEIIPPEGADSTIISWKEWLQSFVGKTIEIEKITPYTYFTYGRVKIINE